MSGPGLLLLAILAAGPGVPARTAEELVAHLQAAWKARDLPGYLALFAWKDAEAREEESRFASAHFAAVQSDLEVQRPTPAPPGRGRLTAGAQAFSVTEPRGRVEQSLYHLEQAEEGWRVEGREPVGRIDGLVHLSLHPQGFRADGLHFRLEDFELEMSRGTLFASPPELGPTAMVFVGEGTVRVRPGPASEREQLRQFAGRPELAARVRAAFVRIHPADLHRVLIPARLEPDPQGARRLSAAQRFYAEQAQRSFVLDSTLPGSPWWLLPSLGDASVTFQTSGHGTLTYALSTSEPESVSLFDRARRRQILLYPSAGRDTRYNEDEGREFDLLHHRLSVRFEPSRFSLDAEDTLRLRLRAPAPTIRLRLDDDFRVHSIRSPQAGEHLFFRVRHQDSLMVSLGPLAGASQEISLTVRYSGLHAPQPVEQEVIQEGGSRRLASDDVPIEDVLVYTNRTVWYPRGGIDDHALADLHFDVPVGFTAVTGGVRTAARVEGGRTRVEYRQSQPGKYISVAVGRLYELGRSEEGPVILQAFAVARARGEAGRLLVQAAAVARLFTEAFGPCPYPQVNLVVIESRVPGGHSPPGMVLLSLRPVLFRQNLRDDPANFTDFPGFFLAHELAHQWWGHGVAGQNYRERWLSEGVAQYAAALWVQRSQGERAFQAVLARMGRWALRSASLGPIHLGHRLGHVKGDPQIYRAVVYDKGAYVLHMLRRIVGDAAFRQGLTAFQARHRYGKAGTDELREALERASGRDLSSYFRAWVLETAIPRLEVASRVERGPSGYRTTVEVRARDLPGPVPLEVSLVHPGGREARTVTLEPTGSTWSFDTAGRPGKVEVNADRGLLVRVSPL